MDKEQLHGLVSESTGNESNNYTKVTQVASQPDERNAVQSGNQEFVIQAEHNGSDWVFFMELVNSTDDTLTLEAVISTEFTGDWQIGSFRKTGNDLECMGRLCSNR